MKDKLLEQLKEAASTHGIDLASVKLDYPEDLARGDYSCNVALANAKKLKMKPKELAEKIVDSLEVEIPEFVESVSVAGPGFINFKLKGKVFAEEIVKIASGDGKYGWSKKQSGRKIMVEYTDPNPFKIFHIGHLMDNAIGESISRLAQSQGAEVKRANWQGDVGLHVAKTVWAISKNGVQMKRLESERASVTEKVKWLGEMYVLGANSYQNPAVKREIDSLNKKIFEQSDPQINELYAKGRQWSLDYFETIYRRLGTKFDDYFFESIQGKNGEAIVREFLKTGVFEESEGAIVFKGEKYGLHTRVFINSQGLPTYEAKELGLNTEKFKLYPDLNESIIVTANEINDYFKVLLKVLEFVAPTIAAKTKHLSHGILRFAAGKMSSRKGNVIAAEDLIDDIKKLAIEKMSGRELPADEVNEIADTIAIGAIKYSLLRQAIGGDVIFDSAASISFEGDSGPYLQYSAMRAASILAKTERVVSAANSFSPTEVLEIALPSDSTTSLGSTNLPPKVIIPEKVGMLERLIVRFPEILERARNEYAPQHVANYLIALAGAFNGYYASQIIIDEKDALSPYRVALTKAFLTTMSNGLWVLGIKVPKKM